MVDYFVVIVFLVFLMALVGVRSSASSGPFSVKISDDTRGFLLASGVDGFGLRAGRHRSRDRGAVRCLREACGLSG